MSANKSPGNTRSDNTGGGGNESSKQGNEPQDGSRNGQEKPAEPGQARKDNDPQPKKTGG